MNTSTHPASVAVGEGQEARRTLRNALGSFATGITIVTARAADGTLTGLTVNSFSSVSLDPPLVLWCLANSSTRLSAFQACTHYAINVLAEDQMELSQRFAVPGERRFAGLDFESGAFGAPVLPGSCAVFECSNESSVVAGDHVIFVGRVERFRRAAERRPLLYHGGGYRYLGQPPFDAAASSQRPLPQVRAAQAA